MNAAAPEGVPPRRINNLKHFGKHRTVPPCHREALKRGAPISAILMVRVWTRRLCPFLQCRFTIRCTFLLAVAYSLLKIQYTGKNLTKSQIKRKKLEPGFPVFRKAVAAIDRAAFCWFKRHFAFFPTI